MKGELFDNVVVRAGAIGIAVNQKRFLSAVVAADIEEITGSPTETKLSVKVEHSDTAGGTLTNVEDTMIDPEHASQEGILSVTTVESEAMLQINMDLLGCKRYIKATPTITFTGGTSPNTASAAYALVLGDPTDSPMQGEAMKKDGKENKMNKSPGSNRDRVKDSTHKRGDEAGGKKEAPGR